MLRKKIWSAVKIENRDRNKWISVHHECSTHLVNQLISCSARKLYREQREKYPCQIRVDVEGEVAAVAAVTRASSADDICGSFQFSLT